MVLNFEVYVNRSTRGEMGPSVTVQRGGLLSVNRDAHELLGKPEAVELLYDRRECVMGFRSAEATLPHAYRVRPQRGSRSRVISGAAFTKYFGIATDATRRYPATMIGDVLTVDLMHDGCTSSGCSEDGAAR